MTKKKSLLQRQKELQALLTSPTGKKELQELASRYAASSDRTRPDRTSIITYILVYEREHGLIDG
jgi:nickel-dependent lactate racemase